MHDVLRQFDLNLLLVFDALFRHRSVVAAADELAMSPSACSHALARLRSALADELFVRKGAAMEPTARAKRWAGGIQDGLQLLTTSLGEGRAFHPASSRQTFVFAATDFTTFALLPKLAARMKASAPWVRIKVEHSRQRDSVEALASGRVHFALGFSDENAPIYPGLGSVAFFEEDYVVLARKGHPRVRSKLSLAKYLNERHVAVVPWDDESSIIDSTLLRLKQGRDVALELPTMWAAPAVVATTDFLLTLPRSAATHAMASLPLALFPVPFRTPPYTLKALFHPRHSSSPGHRWMLDQLTKAWNCDAV
ncbi:bacterial regulatory helix-turn-helix, lysR family protein [Delftia acidovorans]|nr:LysR family transcriptional regulator [Delftia acidovorans]KFJ13022.1 bacterial regulatory helix-turn-helix, lysR family protein [Delftia acidovorans]QQB53690.1 LysR family transcriptional regulator [Delftia acidovorans]